MIVISIDGPLSGMPTIRPNHVNEIFGLCARKPSQGRLPEQGRKGGRLTKQAHRPFLFGLNHEQVTTSSLQLSVRRRP